MKTMDPINPKESTPSTLPALSEGAGERLVEQMKQAMPLRNLVVFEGRHPTLHDFTGASLSEGSAVKGAFYNKPAGSQSGAVPNGTRIKEGFFVNDLTCLDESFRNKAVIGSLQKAFPGAMLIPASKYDYISGGDRFTQPNQGIIVATAFEPAVAEPKKTWLGKVGEAINDARVARGGVATICGILSIMSLLPPVVKEVMLGVFLTNVAWNYFHTDSKNKKDYEAVKDIPAAMAKTLASSLGLAPVNISMKLESRRQAELGKDSYPATNASKPA